MEDGRRLLESGKRGSYGAGGSVRERKVISRATGSCASRKAGIWVPNSSPWETSYAMPCSQLRARGGNRRCVGQTRQERKAVSSGAAPHRLQLCSSFGNSEPGLDVHSRLLRPQTDTMRCWRRQRTCARQLSIFSQRFRPRHPPPTRTKWSCRCRQSFSRVSTRLPPATPHIPHRALSSSELAMGVHSHGFQEGLARLRTA